MATCLGRARPAQGVPRNAESGELQAFWLGCWKIAANPRHFFSQIDIWQSDVSKLFIARRRDVSLMSCMALAGMQQADSWEIELK